MTTRDQREHEFEALLRQQADRVDVPGDFAPAAIAKRRHDQRNRAALGAAAAVAAIAVAVPVLWASRSGPSPVPALTTSTTSIPSPSSSVPTETQTPDRPTGTAAPNPAPTTSVPPAGPGATRTNTYARDDTIRVGDTVIRLEKGTVVENLAVLANGGFVLQSHLGTSGAQSETEILSPAGRTVKALGTSGTYAVSPDGTRVLFKSGAGDTLVVHAADGSVVGQRKDAREVAAIVGDIAYLNGDASRGSLEWNVETGATRELPAHVVTVSPDRTQAALQWFVPTDAMDDVCWAVIDLTSPSFQKTVEKCGAGENPTMFMPGAFSSKGTYLVGSHYVDGGFWFSAGVVQVSNGEVVVGGNGDRVVSGWSWHLDDDESTLLVSRNTSDPLSPATRNTLQRCTLAMECTDAQPQVALPDKGGFTEPRYVVPR